VQAVILIKWEKLAGDRVKGNLELYGWDATRNIVLIQAEVKPAQSFSELGIPF
jgi:hypothetical protein